MVIIAFFIAYYFSSRSTYTDHLGGFSVIASNESFPSKNFIRKIPGTENLCDRVVKFSNNFLIQSVTRNKERIRARTPRIWRFVVFLLRLHTCTWQTFTLLWNPQEEITLFQGVKIFLLFVVVKNMSKWTDIAMWACMTLEWRTCHFTKEISLKRRHQFKAKRTGPVACF